MSLTSEQSSPSTSHLLHPYRRALTTLWVLLICFALPLLVATVLVMVGRWGPRLLVPCSVPLAVVTLMQFVVWIVGLVQLRNARAFLYSERPQVRWTYSLDEWQSLTAIEWNEQLNDWKLQWGCLTGLFGLVGLLVGLLGIANGDLSLLPSIAVGLAVGAILGAAVAAGNRLAAWQARKRPPAVVALGLREVYYDGHYVDVGRPGRSLRSISYEPGDPGELLLVTRWRSVWLRGSGETEWHIPVPAHMDAQVTALVERLPR